MPSLPFFPGLPSLPSFPGCASHEVNAMEKIIATKHEQILNFLMSCVQACEGFVGLVNAVSNLGNGEL